MKIAEIRSKKPDALAKEEQKLKKELMSLRAQVAMGTTPKSPGQVKSIKKTLARIKAVKRENEAARAEAGQTEKADKNASEK